MRGMSATAPHPAPGRTGRLRRFAGSPGRRLAIGVALGFAALIGGTLWRMRSLDGLPDIGDPFDAAEVRRPVEIPDADNAFVAYAAAHQELKNPLTSTDEARWSWLYGAAWDGGFERLTWTSAPQGVRDFLDTRRAAMEIWREGSGRGDAVYHRPGRITMGTVIDLIPDAIVFAALAALEGSRLEEAGARDRAWDWYRAMLRASRLIGRHGTLVQRNFGARVHALAARCILRWAADPRVGAGLLRRALDDTLAADALTPPLSEAIKIDYRVCLQPLENMNNFEKTMRDFGRTMPLSGGRQPGLLDQLVPWAARLPVQRIRLGARNDLERSRRVLRLLFANWLAQADRPAGRRAPPAIRKPTWIYADDPSAPAGARAVSPEVLARAIDRTEVARSWFGMGIFDEGPPWEGRNELAREPRRRSVLIVRLAAEVYRREHGTAPATAGALLGSVLKELPEGIAADDPIPAGLE